MVDGRLAARGAAAVRSPRRFRCGVAFAPNCGLPSLDAGVSEGFDHLRGCCLRYFYEGEAIGNLDGSDVSSADLGLTGDRTDQVLWSDSGCASETDV